VADSLSLSSRILLAWAVFFRVLFDGVFARRIGEAAGGQNPPLEPALTITKSDTPASETTAPPPPEPKVEASKLREEGALLLLSVLQQDGRLIDFLRQDITSFDDAEVGAAARVVHEGCRKAIDAHVTLAAVRAEAEGATVSVGQDETAALVKLTGNVRGSAPFEGKLRHKGWKATKVSIPTPTKGHEMTVVCPAEVEL
jgi:hypothetical protein